MNRERTTTFLGVAAAIGASLCCIGPVVGFAVGLIGLASAFAWATPLRVPLAVITLGLLSFAWYRTVQAERQQAACACDDEAPPVWRRRGALGAVTVAALVLLAFPYYAEQFYPEARAESRPSSVAAAEAGPTARVSITGMTCAGCAAHVETALASAEGVTGWEVSYERAEAVVRYDPERTTAEGIREAVASTGYGAQLAEASL